MLTNVGSKIRAFAEVCLALGIVGSVILGIGFAFDTEHIFLYGVLIGFLGFMGSWIFSLILSGFGAIVESSERMVKLKEIEMTTNGLLPEDTEDTLALQEKTKNGDTNASPKL